MRQRAGALRSLRRCEAGAAAVEFAIISLVMILVSLGVIEFGRGLYMRNQLSYAVDLGARKVLISSSISDADLESALRSGFTAGDPDLLQVTIGTETVDGVIFRTVAASYPFTPLVPAIYSDTITLSVDRRVPVV
jgi:Flp pilus assembly protein TadG